jgi:NAD(P) transhydrogenase subunit alpha
MVPNVVPKLAKLGFEVVVEKGAGAAAGYTDDAYAAKGATLGSAADVLGCELVIAINVPDWGAMAAGQMLACIADPFRDTARVSAMAAAGLTLFSMDMIPRRLSRAQSMDVNSSQDNLAGYKAVLLGAAAVARMIPMMMTSAGTVKPAKYVVMGAGVAGLQAIATAKRLGAVVWASDVRLAAKEQIESLGGKFIAVEGMEDFEDESGYAKPLTPEFIQKVNDTVCEVARDADVVVTTARLFGRPAPITVPASAVEAMKLGTVVVDMNTASGGNCELSVAGETVVKHGVTIIGEANLPGTVPHTASLFYANNLANFAAALVSDGKLAPDFEDEILVGALQGDAFHVPEMGGVLVAHAGEIHAAQSRLREVAG